MEYKRVLIIAGSDSGGGAGIQADIKTMSACGCYATTAITAITVQNTKGVTAIHAIPDDIIAGQIDAVLSDIGTDAVKTGMLHSAATIRIVSEAIRSYAIKNVIIDPVMVATSGDKLIHDDAINILKKELLPMARIITPNLPEAEILLGRKINPGVDMIAAAKELSCNQTVSVMLKAGHLTTNELTDIFFNAETGEVLQLKSKRVDTLNTHGTGCTLASALASFMAQGLPLNDVATRAKEYVNNAIIQGANYKIGHGHGPVHHFYNYWK